MFRDFFNFGFLRDSRQRPTGRRRRARKAESYRPEVLDLENRTLPSTITWLRPVGGDWDDPANWSGGHIPVSNQDAVIPFAGIRVTHATTAADAVGSLTSEAAIDISAGSLTITGASRVLSDAPSRIDALFSVSGGTLSVTTSGDLSGTGTLRNFATLNLGAQSTPNEGPGGHVDVAVDNEAGVLTAFGVINNDAARPFVNGPNATLRVPEVFFPAPSVVFTNGFTNAGRIELINQFGFGAGLDLLNGTLVNAPGATIDFLATRTGGGSLGGNLDNQGTITAEGQGQIGSTGATVTNEGTITVNNPTAGASLAVVQSAFTNSGTITLANPRDAFSVSGGTFEQDGSLAGPGTLALESITTILTPDAANAVGGLRVVNSTLTSPGTLTNLVAITGSTINAAVVNLGSLTAGENTTVNGPFANAAGATLTIAGSAEQPANVTFTQGFTNNGSIVLAGGDQQVTTSAALTVTGGTLTNAPGATLSTLEDPGPGGARLLNAALDNQGTLAIQEGTVLTGSLTNSGTINVQRSDLLVSLVGPGATVVNSGTVTIGSLQALTVEGGDFANSGTVSLVGFGSVVVTGNYAQTGGATQLNDGILTAGGGVDLEGGVLAGTGVINANVLNNAEVDVGQPGSPGTITIIGDYTQTAGGNLVIEIGGLNPGTDFDQLNITGQATLDGTLTVNLINGFRPASGQGLTILTFGSGSGAFADLGGDGPLFTPSFDPMDVTLVAS
jgi:hypothetical protein